MHQTMIISKSVARNLRKDDEYRPGIGIMLLNINNLVFLGKRIKQESMTEKNEPYSMQMPQGGIEPNEPIIDAMYRELYEEVGLEKEDVELISIGGDLLFYNLPKDILKTNSWGHKYIGQKQLWFLLRLTTDDTKINLSSTMHPEFSEYEWVEFKEIPNYAISFKRKIYTQLLLMFQKYI